MKSDYLNDAFTLSHKYSYEPYLITEETSAQRVNSPAQDHSAEILTEAANARDYTLNH